jgi:hypothetical protein
MHVSCANILTTWTSSVTLFNYSAVPAAAACQGPQPVFGWHISHVPLLLACSIGHNLRLFRAYDLDAQHGVLYRTRKGRASSATEHIKGGRYRTVSISSSLFSSPPSLEPLATSRTPLSLPYIIRPSLYTPPSTPQLVMRLSSLVVIAGGLAQLGTANGFSLSRPSLPRWNRRDDSAPQAVLGWFRIRTSTSWSFSLN